MKTESATGVEGHLIYIHGTNKYMFRVYSGIGVFKDYDIWHSDLMVTIVDKDAVFYKHKGGKMILDHSPETLGLVK